MDAGVSAKAPFFLVGSERSGTTLLRLMLSHHPRIECAPEFEFLVEPLAHTAPPPAGGEPSWPELARVHDWLSTNRIFLPHDLTIDPSLDYRALMQSFVTQYCERSGKEVHGATCHKHFDRLGWIWPDVRLVHLLRDGRDVARSCIGMGWAGNVWYGAERWLDAERLWDDLQAVVPEERRIELRYEDLLAGPERELGRVCAFLGTEYDPAMMDYAEASTYSRPDPSLAQQWKRKLSSEELSLLETRMGDMLRRRGYEGERRSAGSRRDLATAHARRAEPLPSLPFPQREVRPGAGPEGPAGGDLRARGVAARRAPGAQRDRQPPHQVARTASRR